MERYKKSIYCNTLDKNVVATFYVHDVKRVNGDFKLKAIDFYKCESQKDCGNNIVIDCPCLKELTKLEWDLNKNN